MRKPVTAGTSVSSASAASLNFLLFVSDYCVSASYVLIFLSVPLCMQKLLKCYDLLDVYLHGNVCLFFYGGSHGHPACGVFIKHLDSAKNILRSVWP